eukprot:6199270-Pleurochrysis_carterae.AAC.2
MCACVCTARSCECVRECLRCACAHHGAEALAHELPGQRRLFLPQLVRGASEAVDDFGDGGLEALDVRAAVWRVDAVGEAE